MDSGAHEDMKTLPPVMPFSSIGIWMVPQTMWELLSAPMAAVFIPWREIPVSYTHLGYECKWATNTVVHILENREYTGCLVNFKTEKLSYKVKHSVENPPEKQVIFENHHEPIIDTQTWERVQELRKQRKRPNRYDEVGLFSGILFCADCGSVDVYKRQAISFCPE